MKSKRPFEESNDGKKRKRLKVQGGFTQAMIPLNNGWRFCKEVGKNLATNTLDYAISSSPSFLYLAKYMGENIPKTIQRLYDHWKGNYGIPAYEYVNYSHSMFDLLLSTGAIQPIHYFAMMGKIAEIEEIIQEDPSQLDALDCCRWTPLFYAVKNQQAKTVEYLLAQGANADKVDINLTNIIELSKIPSVRYELMKMGSPRISGPLTRYIKQKIGFSKKELVKISKQFIDILKEQYNYAKQNGRKLLILIAETHSNYRIKQLEKIMFKCAVRLGISTFYIEQSQSELTRGGTDSLIRFAGNKLNMKVKGVDNYPNRLNAPLSERNKVMSKELDTINQDGIFITGSDHLAGFYQEPEESISRDKFHIVPFNLTKLVRREHSADEFCNKISHAVQVEGSTFSQENEPIKKWNGQSSETEELDYPPSKMEI